MLIDYWEKMRVEGLLINPFDPARAMDDGSKNPNGWDILRDVHPERGNMPILRNFARTTLRSLTCIER